MLVALSQFISVICGFGFTKLVSYYCSVSQYGIYSLSLTLVGLVGLFPFSIFDQAISRHIPNYRKIGTYKKNYTNILLMNISVLCLYLVVLGSFVVFWNTGYANQLKQVALGLMVYMVTNTLRNTLLNIESSSRRRGVVLASRMFEGVTRIMLLVFLLIYIGNINASDLLLLSALVFAINIFYLILKNREDIDLAEGLKFSVLKKNLSSYMTFASPLFVWAIFGWLQSYYPIWLLNLTGDLDVVGQYAMIVNIGMLIPTQLTGIVSSYISPIIYENQSERPELSRVLINKSIRYLTCFYALMFLFLTALHADVTKIVSSSNYESASYMLPYTFLSSALLSIGQISAVEFFARNTTNKLIYPNIISALMVVLIGAFFIPKFSAVGAVSTVVIASSLYMLHVFYLRARIK